MAIECDGAVLYTDGGCKPPSQGIGGYGIHGYLYTIGTPKRGHGFKGGVLTDVGYKSKTDGNHPEVTIAGYIDGIGNILTGSTNNEAELKGFLVALQFVIENNIPRVHFILDSKYVLDGVQNYLSAWRTNGWTRKDGQPIANRNLWQRIDECLQTCHLIPIRLSWEWVKGHSDSLGNTLADALASLAIVVGEKGGDEYQNISVNEGSGYWSPDVDYHPFFNEKSWYFDPFNNIPLFNGKTCYYLGSAEGDTTSEFIGKPESDTSYSVVMLDTPDPVLASILSYQRKITPIQGFIVAANLNNIMASKTYADVAKHLDRHLSKAAHCSDILDFKSQALTRNLDPARRSIMAHDVYAELHDTLKEYVNNDLPNHYAITDVTDQLFTSTPNKKGVDVYSVKPADEPSFVCDVDYFIRDSGEVTERRSLPIVMTFALDLPRRRILAKIASADTKVVVISWGTGLRGLRFATIIITKDAYGIWAAPYANLRLLP